MSPQSNDLLLATPGSVILDGQKSAVQAIFGYGGTTGQNNVTVKGFIIQNFVDSAAISGAYLGAIKTGWGWDIENNELRYNNDGAQLNTNDTFKSNYVHDNAVYGFVGDGSGMLIDSNEVARNNTGLNTSGNEGAMKIHSSWTTNVTLRNNYVHDNYGNGLWCDGCGGGIVFEGNTATGNQGLGIFLEVSLGATIDGNTVSGNMTHMPCSPCSPWWGGDIGINTSQNVNIYSNTVDASKGENAIGLVGSSRTDGPAGGLKNISVHNNTFTVSGSSDNGMVGDGAAYETQPITFDYDTWHVDSLSARHWAYGGLAYPMSWMAFQGAAQELHGQEVTP